MNRAKFCSFFFGWVFLSVCIWFLKSNRNSNKGKVNGTDLPLSLPGFSQHHWSLNASCSGWRGYLKVSRRCCTGFPTSAFHRHLQPFKTYPKINAGSWDSGMVLRNGGRFCFLPYTSRSEVQCKKLIAKFEMVFALASSDTKKITVHCYETASSPQPQATCASYD